MSSGSNPSSMQPQNDSANNSYNGSPAPTIYMSSASYAYHTRYNTVDTQTIITSTSNLSIGETSQVDYQWDNSSLIPTMFDYRQIEVTQSDYPRYLVIDGDSTPGQYSSYTAPTSTRAYNDGYNYVQTVYEEAIEQTTTQTQNETTTPPSPTTVRWASEYQSHEARALGLSPPPNKCASQNRKEGIPTGDMFSSGSSAKSSRSRKKSKST